MQYGTIEYNNHTFALIEQATLTNRCFPGWWGDAQDGEGYESEWSALAEDEDGITCRVYWRFTTIKGMEPDDDSNWPWADEHIYRVDVVD